MPSIQDTAYPRFKKNISQKELRRIYTPTEEEKALCRGARRTPLTSFYFLILFKTLRRLGYFVPLQEVPGEIVRHIAKYLNNSENSIDVSSVDFPSYDVSGTRQRHMREIRNYLKIGAYDSKSKTIIEQAVLQASQTKEDLADIINVAIEELVRQRRELPAFSSLRRFAFKGRAKVNDELHEKIYNGVDSRDREKIDQLFQVREDQRLSPWNRLKEEPGKLTRGNLLEHIARYRQFVLYAIPRASFNGVPEVKIKRFAAEAKSLNAARMKALKEYKMFAIAVCFIQKRVAGILDDLTEMLIKQVRRIHRKARLKLDEIQEKNRYVVDHLIDTLQQILLARTECRSGAERDEAEQAIIGGREESLLENCQTHSAYAGNNYYPFLWKFHANQRWTLFQVLDVLELKSSTQDQSLPQALQFLMSHQRSRATMLQIIDDSNETRESSPKNLIDLSWISKRWWKFVFNTSKAGAPPTVANRRHLELCLFYHLMLGLKSGDIFVENSDRYSDYRTQLISWEEYDRLIELYGLQSGLPVETKAFMKTLKEELFQVAEKVDSAFPHNQYAAIERDEVVMKKSAKKRKPEGLKELEAIISERLKPVSILEVLAGAQKWIQWDRFFGPLSGLDAKLEDPRKHYIYTVFCYGCGVGPSQSERCLKDIGRRQLAWINQRHVTEETLNKALTDVANKYNKFDLLKFWGSGKSASADGMKWELYEQNLLSEFHIRYGGYGGIGYYHVSDTYIALFSNFIPCGAHEGVHILDIFKEDLDIRPDTLHGDTHAQSEVVFGLAHLLGIKLMPRIKRWKHLTFYRPNSQEKYRHIDALFSEEINWGMIETHLPDMLRVALSVKEGKIAASAILRRLSTYSRKNKLYQAFRELGRAVRTRFLLNYLADKDLRETIQAATSKSESYNYFTQWASFGGQGISAENNRDEQRKLIKYNHLVASCVCFYNVFAINQILNDLDDESVSIKPGALSAISPYITRHINRFGEYQLDLEKEIPDLNYSIPEFE